MAETILNYKSIPALAAYIDRIGAEQLNFKRFIIKEHKGHYYTEKCLIRLNKEGEITCNNKDYAPTKEEREQIKGALMAVEWPKTLVTTEAAFDVFYEKLKKSYLEKNRKIEKSDFAIFWSRKEKGIIMVQQRIEDIAAGTKDYVPWTHWNDGEWRAMEPEGALPFWKPKERQSKLIMIHEGAKAAEHVDWLINGLATDSRRFRRPRGKFVEVTAEQLRKTHPWYEELQFYEHWGIIGGALAPHRADYEELRREKPVEVAYICDNDWPGEAALQEVSRHWGGSLKGVKFDNNWPISFDLGDEFSPSTCPKLFANERYIGSSLRSRLIPATWATEIQYTGEKGRPSHIVRRTFREEWFHCVIPECFIHKDHPNELYGANEFNNLVSPFSDVDDTARLLKKDFGGKAAKLSYEPNLKPGLYGSDQKGYFINTFVPSPVKAEKGDYEIWSRFMQYLFPVDEDRLEAERWIATLIARPDIHMLYGMLLVSQTQGVGKTSLGEKILKPLVGDINTSTPSEHNVVESQFNSWVAHKRLAIVSEIYAGHSNKAYDKLKAIITDPTIEVSKKYLTSYDLTNWLHVLASSNSIRALKISVDDRRWFVPKVTEEKKDWAWWEQLNKWIEFEGGLKKIRYWAEEFLKTNDPVKTGEAAPWSSLKSEMIEEGMSETSLFVKNVMIAVKEKMNGHHFIFTETGAINLIKKKFYEGKHTDKLERPLTIRKIAKSVGLVPTKQRFAVKEWGTLESNPHLICSSEAIAELSFDELTALGLVPISLNKFMDENGEV